MLKYLFLLLYTSSLLSCDSVEELRNTFCIENETLIARDNQQYPRYLYESRLHLELAYILKDQALADQIHTAYKRHLHPLAENLDFDKALIEVVHYFGSPDYSPLVPLQKALEAKGQQKWFQLHLKQIQQFVNEASQPLYCVTKNDAPFTVVIISTTCSGGNHSAALSLQASLESKNVRVFVIDVEEISRECDPMLLATRTYTYDMVYAHILQKNNDLSVIKSRKDLYRDIIQYIPNNMVKRLKEKVLGFHPDVIISTRSYTCDDLSLASLGVPFYLFHADYELCPSLTSYYRSVPSEKIRFWVPIEEMTQSGPNFDYVAYPCAYFHEIENCENLRIKWGIDLEDIPIFIAMGKYGTKQMRDIFEELKSAKTNYRFKYFFICGKNEALKIELDSKAPSSMQILGLLTPSEMNEIMNLSFIGISKAGGATVTEAISTKTPLLLVGSYPWEEANADYLTRIGLGNRVNLNEPLIRQIESMVKEYI